MSLIWLVIVLAVGAVYGAKHQAVTLFFYEKVKPTLKVWKDYLVKKIAAVFKKK